MSATAAYGTLRIADDPTALARIAAESICDWALETSGPVRIALSGGSTPWRTYTELAGEEWIDRFPWHRVHWFWGDERFVPPDHPASNFRMAREAMLSRAPVPPENIHPVPTVGMDPDAAAARYEAELKHAYGAASLKPGRPLFHICLLGLGDDGHTASLIPGEAVLEEHVRWVAAVAHGRPETRITLTYPAIDSSQHIAFLVSGRGKRDMLRQVLSGHSDVPAARLHPLGDLVFLADPDAAGE